MTAALRGGVDGSAADATFGASQLLPAMAVMEAVAVDVVRRKWRRFIKGVSKLEVRWARLGGWIHGSPGADAFTRDILALFDGPALVFVENAPEPVAVLEPAAGGGDGDDESRGATFNLVDP